MTAAVYPTEVSLYFGTTRARDTCPDCVTRVTLAVNSARCLTEYVARKQAQTREQPR